jgi:hypothetical protein
MYKLIAILIMLALIIGGYKAYSHYQRQAELEKNKPKVTDFKKDFLDIFFGSDKDKIEKEDEGPQYSSEKINVFIPEKKDGEKPKKTYTNKDIKKLDTSKFKRIKFITAKDIQKLKEKDIDIKIKKEKEPESPLEKIIDETKKKVTDDKN